MPGTMCAVAICRNSQRKDGPELQRAYHRFPKDTEIRKVWMERCRRNDGLNPDTARICSDHFQLDDYERDLKSELMNLTPQKILNKLAVPTLKFKPEVSTSCEKGISNPTCINIRSTRTERLTKRHLKICAEHLISSSEGQNDESVIEVPREPEVYSSAQYNELAIKNKTLESEYGKLKYQNMLLQKAVKNYQTSLAMKDLSLSQLKRELQRAKRQGVTVNVSLQKAECVLSKIFTRNQTRILMDKTKRVNWTKEEISVAFTLRYLSKRAYVFLRKKLNFPLPGVSTLQRWASGINLKQGLLKDVLHMMKVAGSTMSSADKLVVLQFDEVKVKSVYEYDTKTDQIMGKHSQMQVVMARGLFSKWKQPVYIDFDKKMTRTTLTAVIKELFVAGYIVVACVSDMGGGNQGLWRELGINLQKTWFSIPENDERKIYFFADAPHLLKLIRNWLIDTGFVLGDGSIVNAEPLRSLIDMDNHELKVCHSLTKEHLECQGARRQNVRLAAQLLSHSTATALRHFKPGENIEIRNETAEFIETVNSWFDISNSYTAKVSGYPSKSAYGTCLEEQNNILNSMYDCIKKMKCSGKKTLQIFQKAILTSIASLKSLLLDMRAEFNLTYILTHRLNQDSLENFFSQIRSRSGLDDHPTPINALYRIRMIVLGKNPGILQNKVNTKEQTDDEYLTSTVLNVTGILPVLVEELSEESLLGNEICNSGNIYPSGNTVLRDINPDTVKNQVNEMTETEESGLHYIAGWVAKKLKFTHPNLGQATRDINVQSDHLYTLSSWIQHLSYGGLIEPSQEWKNQAAELEAAFCKSHGSNYLNKRRGVVKHLVAELGISLPHIPRDAIYQFIRVRTFIRIKFLNEKEKLEAMKKKHEKLKRTASCNEEQDENRKRCKKMKKIVS